MDFLPIKATLEQLILVLASSWDSAVDSFKSTTKPEGFSCSVLHWDSHAGGLDHVGDSPVLLVLQHLQVEDKGQLLTLVFQIFSPQHGPCTWVKNLELVPTVNKFDELIIWAFTWFKCGLRLWISFKKVEFNSLTVLPVSWTQQLLKTFMFCC